MQKAGIIGHRLYLISNYLGIGCSGIGAYYDEEVAYIFRNRGHDIVCPCDWKINYFPRSECLRLS